MRADTSSPGRYGAWGALFFTLPLAYVFVDPYQRQAAWPEWMLTSLGFAAALGLCVVGIRYSRDMRVARGVCVATLLLAMVFLAFRPAGAILFPMAAAFAPLAVAGRIGWSVALTLLITGVFLLETWFLGRGESSRWLTYAAAIETLLFGVAMTIVARQTRAVERFHKAAERERIARDLHDVLGHSLSSIALKSELAGRILQQDPQAALVEIADIEMLSRRALDEVREAIHGYHAGDIEAEFDRARGMLTTAGIAVESHCDPRQIDPATERVLALVLREAVTNVVRHARASRCRLTLERSDGAYRLMILDDGRGGTLQEGLGMRSIRARVDALGGSASWEGMDGTLLTVAIPIPNGASFA